MAVRTASSRARSIERPSTSVPRLAAPSSSTSPTAASSRVSAGRTAWVVVLCSDAAWRVRPQSSGRPSVRRISGTSDASSRDAAASVTPARSRPSARENVVRCAGVPGAKGSGTQSSVRWPSTSKPGGITPTTSWVN